MAVIKADDVVDLYAETIPNGATQLDRYLPWVQGAIQEMQLPVRVGYQEASTGLLKGWMGRKRQFLVCQPEGRALDVFRMLHWVSPVGSNLAIGWYVVGRKKAFGSNSQIRIPILDNLDLFDEADLRAIYSSLHQFAVMRAIYAVVKEAGADPKHITSKSKVGFFGL